MEWDAETGLYYAQSRYLETRVGRFGNSKTAFGNNPWTVGGGGMLKEKKPEPSKPRGEELTGTVSILK